MRSSARLLLVTLLGAACRGPAPSATADDGGAPPPPPRAREADPMLDTGIMLRSPEERAWGVHLMLPVQLGFTDVDLEDAFSLDQVASLAVVPTAEFIVPLNDYWTLLPFVGLGAAYQTGAEELIGDDHWLGLLTGGLRTTRWQLYSRRHWLGFTGAVRYDAALGVPDGLLGDWGSVNAAVELRRDFGAPREGARFQGGLFFQATYYWDAVELDAEGLAPEVVVNNLELGVSLGSTTPYKVLGIALPRVFLGYFTGDEISGVRIRFGRL